MFRVELEKSTIFAKLEPGFGELRGDRQRKTTRTTDRQTTELAIFHALFPLRLRDSFIIERTYALLLLWNIIIALR